MIVLNKAMLSSIRFCENTDEQEQTRETQWQSLLDHFSSLPEQIQLAIISSSEQALQRGALCWTKVTLELPLQLNWEHCHTGGLRWGSSQKDKEREREKGRGGGWQAEAGLCRNLGHHFHLTGLALNKENKVLLCPFQRFFFFLSQSKLLSLPMYRAAIYTEADWIAIL